MKEFNNLVDTPNFWDDTSKAQLIMKHKKKIEKTIDQIKSIESERENLFELIQYLICYTILINEILKKHLYP